MWKVLVWLLKGLFYKMAFGFTLWTSYKASEKLGYGSFNLSVFIEHSFTWEEEELRGLKREFRDAWGVEGHATRKSSINKSVQVLVIFEKAQVFLQVRKAFGDPHNLVPHRSLWCGSNTNVYSLGKKWQNRERRKENMRNKYVSVYLFFLISFQEAEGLQLLLRNNNIELEKKKKGGGNSRSVCVAVR